MQYDKNKQENYETVFKKKKKCQEITVKAKQNSFYVI